MSDQASFRYNDPGTYFPQATCGGYTATAAAPVVVDPALPAPATVEATPEGDTVIAVTWAAVVGADSYVVTYWPTSDPTETATVESTAPPANVTGLTPATGYSFTVHAVDATGAAGTESAVATATTEGAQLATPTGLSVSSPTGTSAAASWSAVSGATTYLVSWALQSSPGTPVGSTTVAITNHTITGLTPDTDYIVSVVARASGVEDSEAATANFSTLPQLPTPGSVATTNVTADGADVTWTASAGADGYSVSWALTASPSVPIGTSPDTASPYTITGLDPSTGYTVTVTATDSTGAAADSAPGTTTFTTTA